MDALTYSHFSFSYAGAQARVLKDVTWSVEQGSFVLLVGNTGSGKTTLLRCAKPEIAPAGQREGDVHVQSAVRPGEGAMLPGRGGVQLDEGDVCVRGAARPGEGLAEEAHGLQVGYVFQCPESQIVCDTVWHELAFGLENLGVCPDVMRRRVAEVAHFFGIEPWFHRDTASLSGGQKQLLNLAAVLAMQPRVLLLDEPTAQLDPVAQRSFLHALFRVSRELGVTVVVATHAPEIMVDYATAAARVEDGRVVPCALEELRPRSCGCAHGTREGSGAGGITGVRAMRKADAAGGPCARSARKAAASARSDVALSLEDVFFRYERDAQWVLRGASVSFSRGRIHAVVGGNGCGKSTALRVLAGALRPERGHVRNAFQRDQALLPQDPRALLVCDTVYDELAEWSGNVGYGADEIDAIMSRFGLSVLADHHPFDTSGGQQQKIALAKLLLTRPQLLLLDEPAKGLDAPSKVEMARTLVCLRDEGVTLVLVTHDLAFASCVADDVTMLFDGEAACQEPTRAFFENNLFYRAQPDRFTQLWYAQERGGEPTASAALAQESVGGDAEHDADPMCDLDEPSPLDAQKADKYGRAGGASAQARRA